jgi:uncharacterized Zn-binding protein involved in type VI secretion
LIVSLALVLIGSASGCAGGNNDTLALNALQAWLQEYQNNGQDSQDSDGDTSGPVLLRLTYLAGRSPVVFTHGWIFGASCTSNGKDYSDNVKWSGSGEFTPDTGSRSRPVFSAEGLNTITLSVDVDGKSYNKSFKVNAISPVGYAYVGCKAQCPADGHGAPMDPTSAIGPITTGSNHVLINGHPAARVGDVGIHAVCSGPNTFKIVSSDSEVLIDGRRAAKIGSITQHCGGMGHIVEGATE